MKKYTAYVCSHTHWDREWYAPFQQFRLRLVRLIDNLLKLLDSDPNYKHFNFDGQTIILEDYLEVCPDKSTLLQRFIQSGRITVGPWYVLPDEFCVSGESLIRNLLKGHQIAYKFGGCLKTGYLPDMFGHISQMPQILRGFDIDNAIIWRGVSGDKYKSEAWWQSPDGSQVLTYLLPQYCGYANAALYADSLPPHLRKKYPKGDYMLTQQPEEAVRALAEIVKVTRDNAHVPVLLLLNGVDNMEPQPELPGIIERANKIIKDTKFVHARLDDFIGALRKYAKDSFQIIKGELKDTVWTLEGWNIVLPNVLSSRVYLKMANERCQTILERWAEPTSVWALMLGYRYQSSFLNKAWQYLMQNHPHDSIGGCSIDQVHRPMESRFDACHEIAEAITEENLYNIAMKVDTSSLQKDELGLLIFNPLNWEVDDILEVKIDIPHDWFKIQEITVNEDNVYKTVRNLHVADWEGKSVLFQIISIQNMIVNYNYLQKFVTLKNVVRVVGKIHATLPGFGYATYRIKLFRKPILSYGSLITGTNTMENEYIRVTLNSNGSFNLLDKLTKHEFKNLGFFEDGGDNGDGYTYSPPKFDSIYNTLSESAHISIVENGPVSVSFRIELEWKLPVSLNHNRQEREAEKAILKIISIISLGKGSQRVDIKTIVCNTIKDHRLRVAFPTYLKTDTCWSEGHFDIIERPIEIKQPPSDVWIEDQPREYPQQFFCGLSNKKFGLAIANKGLLEFAVSDNPEHAVYITLLRAVNWLGAGSDPNTIQGGAGPRIETPDSQCQRELTFHYSVIPHKGKRWHYHAQKQAHQHAVGIRTYVVTEPHKGNLSHRHSFILVKGDNVMVSSVKQAEDGNGIIVRLWNSGDTPTIAKVEMTGGIKNVALTNLLEEVKQQLPIKNRLVEIKAGKKQIVTLRLHFR